jgi:DnaJ like chaperone protein
MSIFGKLAGAGVGLAIGGPIGALLGAVAGHYALDEDILKIREKATAQTNQIAFTMGVIALSAKMAKADGVVTHDEVKAFNKVFDVAEDERVNVRKIFQLAHQDVAGYELYAKQLAKLFGDRAQVLEDVLDGLFYIAMADGVMHPDEMTYLEHVATIFGFDKLAFSFVRERHIGPDKADPYVILGVERAIADKELKSAYRKLVVENHPDRAIARGVPEEMVALANERLAAINAAYDRIASERGL